MSGTWGNVVRNVGARKQTIHAELGGHHGWFCAGKSKREQREEIDSEPGGMTFHNVYSIVCERDTGERARTRQHVFHFDGSQWKGCRSNCNLVRDHDEAQQAEKHVTTTGANVLERGA